MRPDETAKGRLLVRRAHWSLDKWDETRQTKWGKMRNDKKWNEINQGEIKRDRWHSKEKTVSRQSLFSFLITGVTKKPTDSYQQTASCPPNHCRCDNWIIRLLWSFHLIEKLHFLLSGAQFNSSELPPFPSLASAPQLWSYLHSSAGGTGEITQSQLPVTIHWLKASLEERRS